MDYNISFRSDKDSTTSDHVQTTRLKINNDEKDKGFAALRKGQLINGVVVSINDRITLNFGGLEITTGKELLNNAVVGDIKRFEVLKVTNMELELKVLFEESMVKQKNTYTAPVRLDKDQETLKTQKEQSEKRAEKEKEYQNIKSKMEQIVTRFTENDYQNLMGEGFPVEELTIEGLYAALNRIKTAPSEFNKNAEGQQNIFTEKGISERLEKENLPATIENLQKVMSALELSDITPQMNGRTFKHIIAHELEPTIENIYKAYYSANDSKQEKTVKLSSEEWEELRPQAEEVIVSAGYEVTTDHLEDARWLIENKLPLTKKTFNDRKALEDIKLHMDKGSALDKMIEGMKYGIAPKDISLQTDQANYDQLISDIQSITDETISQAVRTGEELSIHKLKELQLSRPANEVDENEPVRKEYESIHEAADKITSEAYEEIKAKRQLEEIRLKMTAEAAARLDKKGIPIETERLEKVVEELRKLEDSFYKELFREASVEATDQDIQTLKETTESITKLKYIPNSVLGSTLLERRHQTIPELLQEGNKLLMELGKAGEAYETLMTTPNREYGDSIQKAFNNMESLLKELGIENMTLNQRAVKILGYNGMDITPEAIERVKAYDLEVMNVIQNLHPAVTVRMIKEGKNPLELSIPDLNRTIDRMKEEQGITSEEKFSTYLRKLEKEEGITAEERKAYIGIYRLLYQVEKTDGAALGAVLKADREVTLDSLLTAVHTGKKGRIDSAINDEFGMLESISHKGETISEQIKSVFASENEQESITEQNEYLTRILRNIKEEISPDKLKQIQQGVLQGAISEGQPYSDFAPAMSSDKGIWETLANIPVEKIFDQLQSEEGVQRVEEKLYEAKVQEIRELCKNADQSIRFLNDYKLPNTITNIMMANHILSDGESPIKKLLKQQNENVVENSENDLKETQELTDTLIDKNSMLELHEKLENEAKESLERACSEERIDSKRLAELKNIGMQMTFLKTLAEKEFYRIPIETENGITNMNLTIVRSSELSGKVHVTVGSKQLGNIKAELSLKNQTLKGFISCDNREGLEQLQEQVHELEQTAKEEGIKIKQLDFGIQQRGIDSDSYQNSEQEAKDTSIKSDTERLLYRMAKTLVITVRAAELAALHKN